MVDLLCQVQRLYQLTNSLLVVAVFGCVALAPSRERDLIVSPVATNQPINWAKSFEPGGSRVVECSFRCVLAVQMYSTISTYFLYMVSTKHQLGHLRTEAGPEFYHAEYSTGTTTSAVWETFSTDSHLYRTSCQIDLLSSLFPSFPLSLSLALFLEVINFKCGVTK